MFTRLHAEPGPDVAAVFRDHVGRLGGPDRRHSDAEGIRTMLAHTSSRVGLRQRLDRATGATSVAPARSEPFPFEPC